MMSSIRQISDNSRFPQPHPVAREIPGKKKRMKGTKLYRNDVNTVKQDLIDIKVTLLPLMQLLTAAKERTTTCRYLRQLHLLFIPLH